MAIKIHHLASLTEKHYTVTVGERPHRLLTMGVLSYGHQFFLHWEGEPSQVTAGRFTSIAHDVRFFVGQEHRTDWATTYPFTHLPQEWPELRQLTGHPHSRGDIIVGHDVWIGYGALIRSGVTIGHGAVVGMGAVVTTSVPPYAVVAGAPAKVIRYRFSSEIVQALLALAWWDRPLPVIRPIAPLLCRPLTAERLAEIEQQIGTEKPGE